MKRLHLSPSEAHARLLDGEQRLAFAKASSPASWRRALVRDLERRTGLAKMPPRPAPRARRLWTREIELGTVQKLVMTVEPGADVPMFLCLPRGRTGPVPLMICLGGHHSAARASIGLADDEISPLDVAGDRAFAVGCLRRGVGALCVEQRAFGERRELVQRRRFFHNDCHDAAMRALLLGRTLLGERVYDVRCAIDWLETRREVDAARVGVMGNSGGGTTSMWSAALDRRVALLIASCSFSTFRASIAVIHHCADNYVPGVLEAAELPDVVGLVAPRPAVIVAGRHDEIFPLAGVRAAVRDLRRVYAAQGAEARLRLVVGPEGHRFYERLAWDAVDRVAPSFRA